MSKSSHSKSIHWIKLCKPGVWRLQKSHDQWSWRPCEMWCHSIGCCEKATDALIYSSDFPLSPVRILFCTYGILLNPFRYFTNMSDILQKENVCFTHIIWIVYTYFSNIEKKFVAYLSLLIFKKKQDKNGVLHILFAPHAKLHTEKPLWLSIIGHLLGVITRIFVLYESDFWLRIIWKINKTSEWGKGKL